MGRSKKSDPLSKVTVLDGYCASGDMECFCFDKRTNEEMEAERQAIAKPWSAKKIMARVERNERCRVYPDDLLPETDGQRGRWRITVEFWPEDPR